MFHEFLIATAIISFSTTVDLVGSERLDTLEFQIGNESE